MTTMKSDSILKNALALNRAIPAFNIPYLPMMEPVTEAIRDADTVAFVAVARLEWTKFQARGIREVQQEFARFATTDHVRLHLDHIPVIDEDNLTVDYEADISLALDSGYQSVMIDGSRLSFGENVRSTARAVELAARVGVPVEAELGAVLGHEANPSMTYEEILRTRSGFTDPDEAARFVRESGCHWLSIAFGNIHGAVSEALRDKPKVAGQLDVEHLQKIWDGTGIPLVLHGGSGIPREGVHAAIKAGIAKVNVGTDIRQEYERGLRTADMTAAKQATYDRTRALLKEHFMIEGMRAQLLGETAGS